MLGTWSRDLPSKLGESTLKRCPLPGVFRYFLYEPRVTSWTSVLLERGDTKAKWRRNCRKTHDKLNYMNLIFLRVTETNYFISDHLALRVSSFGELQTTSNFLPSCKTNFMNATEEAEQVCQPHLGTVIKPT